MLRRPLIAIILCLCAASCGKGDKGDSRSIVDPALEAVQINAAEHSETGGVTKATIKVASQNTQVVKASATSAIAGAQLTFLPGAFDIDFDVALAPAKSIASKKNLAALGLGAEALVTSAGPAVSIAWSFDEDSARPLALVIPLPPAPTGVALAGTNLAVIFIRNVPNSPDRKLGLLGAKSLAADAQAVTFSTSSYGTFQAVYLSEAAAEVVDVATTEPLDEFISVQPGQQPTLPDPVFVPTPANGAIPEAFALVNPAVGRLVGAKARVSWEASKGASSYEVRVHPTDAACASGGVAYADIQALAQIVDVPADGQNYVCVFAKNEFGAAAASNMPYAMNAERSPPPAPVKPRIEQALMQTVIVNFTWDAVTDVGSAGFNNFNVEIGTTPGGNDVLISDPTKPLESFQGRTETTYYCRVRAVDKAGNVSEWSPVSDGVTIDTDSPGNLAGFSATTGDASGAVTLTFDYSNGESYKYKELRILRRTGATPPTAESCETATPVMTLKAFSATTVTDETGSPGGVFSYRLCILDRAAFKIPANTAASVQAGG